MKPKDLKARFNFENRRSLLCDGVLYVPVYYTLHEGSVLQPLEHYFGNCHPHCIEYCSGNGDWIVQKAMQEPDKNWIGVERRFDRVRKIWAKVKNRSLSNLLIVCGEALTFTKHYLLDSTIDQIYINFPDPWPKLKHAKHRLIDSTFLDELSRVLKRSLTFVTDDRVYLEAAIQQFLTHGHFTPHFPAPFFTTHLSNYGTSWFENLWREKGKEIYYTSYYKQNGS